MLAPDEVHHWWSDAVRTFECLVNIDGLFGTRLKVWDVALGLTEGHGTLVRDLCSH
jgi:hypothetical protein